MAFPTLPILRLLDDYEQSRGNHSIFSQWRDYRIIICVVMVLLTIAEITIYVIFFHHMYVHDNQERLRRLLEPGVIKLRNRTNAITFFGQFCSFVFEFSIGILTICGVKGLFIEAWGLVFVLKVTCFTCMSMVEVLTSSTLRPRIFKF